MKKIERPDWEDMAYVTEIKACIPPIKVYGRLDAWFKENVEPNNTIIDRSFKVIGNGRMGYFSGAAGKRILSMAKEETFTGYIIECKSNQKETAEDVLRDLINIEKHPISGPHPFDISELQDRAKKVLNE